MEKQDSSNYSTNLSGHLLVATPQMTDPRFKKSAILICQHDQNSAMGLVINQPKHNYKFSQFLDVLKISKTATTKKENIYIGGPVDTQRGYILHSSDFVTNDSIKVCENVFLSIQIDIIKKIVLGLGPKSFRILLGYSGWTSGQLEFELRQNMWFNIPAQSKIIFSKNTSDIWENSFSDLGMSASSFSSQIGNS